MVEYYYARIAYDAYCKQTGGKSLISGDPLPQFDALRLEIKQAWLSAATAILEELTTAENETAEEDV
jgi:hypothetical protein